MRKMRAEMIITPLTAADGTVASEAVEAQGRAVGVRGAGQGPEPASDLARPVCVHVHSEVLSMPPASRAGGCEREGRGGLVFRRWVRPAEG